MGVWVDTTSLATAVALDVNGDIVEDACRLRPESDTRYVNLVELDAVLKG